MSAKPTPGEFTISITFNWVDGYEFIKFVKNLHSSSRLGEFTTRPARMHSVLTQLHQKLKKAGFDV